MSKPCLICVVMLLSPCVATGQGKSSPVTAAKLFQEASRLQNTGKFADAAGKWQAFLRDYPSDPALGLVYQGLGACLLEMGDWQAAIDALNLALKNLPAGESPTSIRWNLAVGMFRRAEQTQTEDHRKQVEVALKHILDDPQTSKDRRALAAFYLARTELALEKKTAAKQRFEQLLKATTDKELVPPVLLALAGLAEEAKDWPKARDYYRDFLGKFPSHTSSDEARLGLADVLLRQEQYKESEELFGQLTDRQGLAAEDYIHFRWAEIAELKADPKTAAKRWIDFLDKYPKSPLRERALRRTGQLQFRLKEYSEAAKAFTNWLNENPTSEERAPIQVQLGLALMQLDKTAEAEGQFKAALERLPEGDNRAQALLGMARCVVKLKRPSDAVKTYAELLGTKGSIADPETTNLEAVSAAFAAGDAKQGLIWTDRMVESYAKSPLTSHAQLQATRYLTEHDQFEAALERSRWVLQAKVAEVQPGALYLAGFCAAKLRKFSDAITYYQTLRDDYPKAEQAPVAAYSLGVVFESQGALSKALAAYQVFLKRYADHALASEAKKRVQLLQGNR
jgi:TolA-binding protein